LVIVNWKIRIKKLFNSDYGHNSWIKYIDYYPRFNGSAFSEELADSVGVTKTGITKSRQ